MFSGKDYVDPLARLYIHAKCDLAGDLRITIRVQNCKRATKALFVSGPEIDAKTFGHERLPDRFRQCGCLAVGQRQYFCLA